MKTDPVTVTFAALADPTRRAILARLTHGEASVGELSEPFPMSMPAISKHLRILEKAELITRTKAAQWRRCKLRPEGFQTAASWLQDYEKFWSESFDRLAEHLAHFPTEQSQHQPAPPPDHPQDPTISGGAATASGAGGATTAGGWAGERAGAVRSKNALATSEDPDSNAEKGGSSRKTKGQRENDG